MSEVFEADSQFNDWIGNIALDSDDLLTVLTTVSAKAGLRSDEFLVGLSFFKGSQKEFGCRALFVKAVNFEDAQVKYEALSDIPSKSFELSIDEFFALWKRISIVVEKKNFSLIGKNVEN